MISGACGAKSIAATDCKTPQIGSFEDGINDMFGLTNAETKADVPEAAMQMNKQLQQLNFK